MRVYLAKDPIYVLAAISTIIIGADTIAITKGVRLTVLTMPLAFLLMARARSWNIYVDRQYLISFLLFLIIAILSISGSYNINNSILYCFWIAFSGIVVCLLFFNLALLYDRERIARLVMITWRLHAGYVVPVAILKLALGMRHDLRVTMWFYEPSNFSIFLLPYYAVALHRVGKYGVRHWPDLALSLAGLIFLFSGTAIIGILLLGAMVAFMLRVRLVWFISFVAVLAALTTVGTLLFQDTAIYGATVGWLLNSDAPLEAVTIRGGNRVKRFMMGYDAAKQHPWLGIGVGADEKYSSEVGASADLMAAQFLDFKSDTAGWGQPFLVTYSQIAAECGYPGLIAFLAIVGYALYVYRYRITHDPISDAYFVAFFATNIAIQMGDNYLRQYIWAFLGLALAQKCEQAPQGMHITPNPASG